MMFHLPPRTLYNRKIPKNKFYEKLQANTKLKEMFVDQVDYILWKHKLSQETTNLEPTDDVQEIQVFEIHLKQREFSIEILENIDKAIPYPILHVLIYLNEARLMIAYKQRNQKDGNKFIVNSYYEIAWQPMNQISMQLLNGLDLKSVYENIIKSFMTIPIVHNEDLDVMINKQNLIEKLQKECAMLETKMKNEKQFNRKVEMNITLQKLKKELEHGKTNNENT